jgi:hypothetical protein
MGRKPQRPKRKKNEQPEVALRAEKTPQADTRSTVERILEDCDHKRLAWLEWLATNGRYISGEGLAVAIEANPGQPLPDGLRDYLCRFLRGKVKRKPGPKGSDAEKFIIEFLAATEYRKVPRRLQRERKFRGREAIAKSLLSPHEEAVKVIKERFRIRFKGVTPRRVANIISSHN